MKANSTDAKITWSLRDILTQNYNLVTPPGNYSPKVGDVIGASVIKVANHTRVYSFENKYLRLFKGDVIYGVLGYRYASDAFHADTIDMKNLHLLTNAGLIGTVKDKNSNISEATRLQFEGVLIKENGNEVLNLKTTLFHPENSGLNYPPVIFVVGSGMNTGKTTTMATIGRALFESGVRVALLKVTGSVAQRDIFEFESTGVNYTADFSDYGFPSTYLSNPDELEALFTKMLMDADSSHPDIVLAEIADGILQRETQILLRSKLAMESSIGVILTAPCACSALTLTEKTRQIGYLPIAVTGIITNSPLFMKEFSQYDATPVIDTKSEKAKFVEMIKEKMKAKYIDFGYEANK